MGKKHFNISIKRSYGNALCLSAINFYPQIIPDGMFKDPKLTLFYAPQMPQRTER